MRYGDYPTDVQTYFEQSNQSLRSNTLGNVEDLSIPELSALLSAQTQSLGQDHPDTLATRHVLARRIAQRNNYEQAIPLYQQLVADRSRILGERHRDTLTSKHNLALCLASCHRLDEARRVFEDVIQTLEETYGKEDDDVIRTRQWYLNDVISVLESPEILEKEYRKLIKLIATAGRRRVNRNQWILQQFKAHMKLHGKPSSARETESQDESTSSEPSARAAGSGKPKDYEPKLQSWMAKRVWGELNGELEQWQSLIASDARAIAQSISPLGQSAIETLLKEQFSGAQTTTQPEQQFEVLHRLVARESNPASRLATQLAKAYIDFAYFAIHVSSSPAVSAEATIDALRLRLRSILGQGLDVTSDAEIEFEKSFQNIVGLENVKRDLMGFVRVLLHNRRELARGGIAEPPRLHLAFVGSPGTGKTTVARLYGRLLFELGLLESDKFTEIDKSSIASTYIGGAESEARDLLKSAMPGVLFIDEAYSLNDSYSNGKGVGQRALEVIIKSMEDNRSDLAVILAGYKREMEDLMKVNPGLPSRIGATIEFFNYSVDELIEIAHKSASRRGLSLSRAAESRLRGVLEKLLPKDDFGNAREIESLIEEAQRNLLTRIAPLDDLATREEQCLLLEDDIPFRESPSGKRVGFYQ